MQPLVVRTVQQGEWLRSNVQFSMCTIPGAMRAKILDIWKLIYENGKSGYVLTWLEISLLLY
jgi:hypothetical protein